MSEDKPTPRTGGPENVFATTHWSVVLAASRPAEPYAQAALEELCRTYWFPLYAYIRHRGYTKQDAEDLTQAFFESLLEKNHFMRLSHERGRFRGFLLASLKHFLANEWDKSQRQKRGGGVQHLSLDWHSAETQFQVASSKELNPDQAYDREWAVALLGKVIERLHAESATDGKQAQFQRLKIFLTTAKAEASYAQVARDLGQEESSVRVAVHRLRKRYGQVLRDEIVNTLSDPSQVDEELRSLFRAFGA